MITRCSWPEAQEMAKNAPTRGYLPPASAVEIVLPGISDTYTDINALRPVRRQLKMEYERARGEAFAYGRDADRERAEDLLDRILSVRAIVPRLEAERVAREEWRREGWDWRTAGEHKVQPRKLGARRFEGWTRVADSCETKHFARGEQ